MQKLLLAVILLGGLASSPVYADAVLTLAPVVGDTLGPQSTSNPCIIAGTNCQQPAIMGFNNFTSNGNTSAYNMFSTTPTGTVADGVQGTSYTSLQLALAVHALAFTVAIDVNTTSANSERLLGFDIFQEVAGPDIRLAHFTGPADISAIQNGNGFGDYTLTGFTFAGLGFDGTEKIYFRAQWDQAVDGAESFWLIGTGPNPGPTPFAAVPGPIVGAGLPGLIAACFSMLGFSFWRRRRNLA